MNEQMFEPGIYFPQCHASCLLPLEDGRMLCAYFAGTHEKHNDVGIWLSEHNGVCWLAPRLLIKVNEEPHWNPVLFPVKDGIRLVFKVGHEIPGWRSYTMLSPDNGKTWKDLHEYKGPTALGPVRSKPVRLSNGFLLAPNSEEEGGWLPYIDLSRNEGVSFERLSAIPINRTDNAEPDYITGRGAIQPTLWQDDDGSVHALLRTSAGWIFRSDSNDNGYTWCRAYPLDIPNNNSGIDVVHAPDGRLFLACNPVSGDFVARTPLCIYVSTDRGMTFKPFAVVDDTALDPLTGWTAEFSYPSLVIQHNRLLLSYTWNRRSIAFWSCSI